MTVKIIKCSGEFYWYRDAIGQEFEVMSHSPKNWVLAEDITLNVKRLIKKEDCENGR